MAIEDNASLAMIPAAYAATTLYSVIPSNGNGDFTHSRTGNATRVNKGGFIETMGSNVPRLDYPLIDGVVQDCPALLLEPLRNNQQPYSEDFSGYAGANFTVVSDDAISPDGSQNADFIKENSGSNQKYFYKDSSITSGTEYTQSIFVKSNGTRYFQITGSSGFSTAMRVNFDLQEGVITLNVNANDASITKFPNDWYRVSVTDTATSTTTGRMVYGLIGTADAGRLAAYSGDTSKGVYAWGAMLEAGDFLTSYIPNLITGSTTRNADECNSAGTSAEFNDSEGVFFAEISSLAAGSVRRFAIDNNTSPINIVRLEYSSTTNRVFGVIYNGSSQIALSFYVPNELEFNKVAFKYKSADFALWVNGYEVSTSSSVFTMPSGLQTLGFDDGSGGNDFYSKSKQVLIFKTALSDSDLEDLTSWDSFSEMAKGQLYTIE